MTEFAPRHASLVEHLDRYARIAPTRQAALSATQSLDYATLRALTDEIASAMHHIGLQPGDRVGFCGPPGLHFWLSFLASLRVGAVWLGLNPGHTEREFAHQLRDARPLLTLVAADVPLETRDALRRAAIAADVSEATLMPSAVQEIGQAIRTRMLLPRSNDSDSADLAAAGVALLVYTSGTTGTPKGALIKASGLSENAWWISRRMNFEPQRALANLPVNHVGCVGDVCATTLVAGGTLIFMDRFDAAKAVVLTQTERITWLPQVPAQFQLLIAKGGLDARSAASVRYLTWGGDAMALPLIQRLSSWVPDLFNSYGLTECSGTITVTAPGADASTLAQTVGKPVDPAFVRVASESSLPAPPGVDGEVQMRGPHIFHGYLHNPEATRATFTPDGWMRTGDLGCFDAEGNLRLLGRKREMFKSGGYNIYPREIEIVIEALRGVELCAVLGIQDELWGEVGVAYVQADPTTVTDELLRQHCSAFLAKYKVPKRFTVRPTLPLLPIGKVDKQALRLQELSS